MPGNFFDTNVLLYVASGDPAKADRAEALMRRCALSFAGRSHRLDPSTKPASVTRRMFSPEEESKKQAK